MLLDTGVVRPVDELGRVVIPKEIRKLFDLNKEDPKEPKAAVHIYVNRQNGEIILKKYEERRAHCSVCGCEEKLHEVKSSYICDDCLKVAQTQKAV